MASWDWLSKAWVLEAKVPGQLWAHRAPGSCVSAGAPILKQHVGRDLNLL